MKTTTRLRTNDVARNRADIMKARPHQDDPLPNAVSTGDARRQNGGPVGGHAGSSLMDANLAFRNAGRAIARDSHTESATQDAERARSDERARLARELHDGLLQGLTGAALQLENLLQLLERDPEAARARLCHIKDMIVQEQAVLRRWIQGASDGAHDETVSAAEFSTTLTSMCERVEWQWGLRVTVTTMSGTAMTRSLASEIQRLVHEALSNVARHAGARTASVQARTTTTSVRIVVQDDGHGFPFLGRYDLDALRAANMGPRTLKERVASLGGELKLSSTATGSRIEVDLPLNRRHSRDADGARIWR